MENQNLRTQIEALKPKSYKNVVCDQTAHRSETSSLFMAVNLPKIQNNNTQNIKDEGKPKYLGKICEDEDFQKNLNYFRLLRILILEDAMSTSSLCDYMFEDSQGIRIEDFTPTQEE